MTTQDTTGTGATRSPVGPPQPRRDRLALVSAGVPFRAKVALVWIAIFAVLGFLFWAASFDNGWIREHIGFIARGLVFTLIMAAGGIALAIALALVGALGRLSRNPVAYGVSGFYTSFFRGTPLIVQLFLFYLAMPQDGAEPRGQVPELPPDDLRRLLHLERVPGGDRGARTQLRRVHDGDLPRRDPVGESRPGRGRRRAGDDLPAEDAPRGPSAGAPGRDPADRERVHRDDEGHGTGLDPRAGDRVDGALPPGPAARERRREADGGARHGSGALLGPDGRLHVLPEQAGAQDEQGIRTDRRGAPGPGSGPRWSSRAPEAGDHGAPTGYVMDAPDAEVGATGHTHAGGLPPAPAPIEEDPS